MTHALALALAAGRTPPTPTPERYVHVDVRYVDGPTAADGHEHGRTQRRTVKARKLHIRQAHRTWHARTWQGRP